MLNRPAGIDLGTTNSAIALMRPEGDDLLLLEDRLRRTTFPSMVGWDPQKEAFITGFEAWNRRVMEPRPVGSIKRKMGTQQRVELGPHEMLPEEVSSKILEELVSRMRTFVDDKTDAYEVSIERAVITVPAYFDAPQIEATRKAGELAGVEVLGLLQEPTAAAMYYAWKHGIGDGNFLVYDLGGGTFDVSVIRSLMGEYQVLAIDGDNYLGGDDFDRRLAEKFRQHLVDQGYELDLDIANNDDDRVRFLLLERVAREVKEALTTSEFQYVGRRDLFEDQAGQPVTLDMEVGRIEFEELIEDLIDQSIEACERALEQSAEQADVGLSDIDYVLLVGGSTRVPLVQQKVAEALCPSAEDDGDDGPLLDEPDTCVGLGAAIHAANLAGLTWV
ncbi:MAG: Hsp70 family protein, partial [Persicimonas sp.]